MHDVQRESAPLPLLLSRLSRRAAEKLGYDNRKREREREMGALRVLMLSVVLALVIAGIRAEEAAAFHADIAGSEFSDSPLKHEIEQLKSKISSLESTTLEKERELKSKDEQTAQLKSLIQEKAASVASLQSEIELLQKKGAVDAEKLAGKAHEELEKKVEKLKNDVDARIRQRDALETRAMEAEKKVQELSLKLESLEKTNDEQKRRIKKTERALQVAEEELIRARLESTSKSKELKEVNGAWFPPWLAYHIVRSQDIAAVYWNQHGKPVLDILVQKASEISGQAQKLVEPHLETAKTKWIPAVKARWIILGTNVRPHIEKASTKTVEIIDISRSSIKSHIVKLHGFTSPYIQEAKKFSKPYIEQTATFTKPYVKQVRTVLKPYTRRVIYSYGKFLETARTYHHQIQDTVQENLKKHELTKPLATKELVWFVASASLAIPIFIVYKMLSAMFCKKTTKPIRGGRSHNHRRHKRRHADQ